MCTYLCSAFLYVAMFCYLTEIFLFFIYLINDYGTSLKCQALLDSRHMVVKGYLWSLPLGVHNLSGKTKGMICKKDEPSRTEGRVCQK